MIKYLFLFSFFLMLSCQDKIDNNLCNQAILIDSNAYSNTTSNNFFINSIEIIDNCLIINYGASGCDGNSWQEKLIDSELILESSPPQRNLAFSLENFELCTAYFTKEVSFDISSLQVGGQSVFLNIENGENDFKVLYEY